MKNKRKACLKEKGITLVALVVTIVVLLILAGITITFIMGDNSVFNQASEAKRQTEIANYKERLEMAKSTIIMQGLGRLEPEKYMKYIQDQGIAKNVIDNRDGTYDITTEGGYVFLVTLLPDKENPTDAEIEYLGKEGNLQPKIKGITILEATKTSFKVKVGARLEGGTVECYYKDKASVATDEVENDTTGYTSISLDSSLVGEVTSGLEAGKTYKIKAVLRKDGTEIGWVSNEVTTSIIVTSVTLNKTTTTIGTGRSETLTATILPENAENKELKWTSSSESVATVDQTGKVTGVAVGTATITATNTESGKSGSCTVTVEQAESNWTKIAEVAKAIAEGKAKTSTGGEVTKNSNEAIVTLEGETEPTRITVGNTFYVKVDGETTLKEVIVLGFNHDDLATPNGAVTKAGITFQFKHFMTDTGHAMNSNNTNNNGWGGNPVGTSESDMRTYLEGTNGIGKLSATLQSKIKQVKKKYLLGNNSSTVLTSNDKLWLLSCSEIFSGPTSSNTGGYGYAKGFEGDRYKYYKNLKETDTSGNSGLIKKKNNGTGSAKDWWLRSPRYNGSTGFCRVGDAGSSSNNHANASGYVSPGFAI